MLAWRYGSLKACTALKKVQFPAFTSATSQHQENLVSATSIYSILIKETKAKNNRKVERRVRNLKK